MRVPLVCTPPILFCTTAKVAESRQGDDGTNMQNLQNEAQTGSEGRTIGDPCNRLTTYCEGLYGTEMLRAGVGLASVMKLHGS